MAAISNPQDMEAEAIADTIILEVATTKAGATLEVAATAPVDTVETIVEEPAVATTVEIRATAIKAEIKVEIRAATREVVMIVIEETIDIHQQPHHLVVAVAATREMTTESAHTSEMLVMQVVMLAGIRGHGQILTAAVRVTTEVAAAAMVAPVVEGAAMTQGSKEAAVRKDTR